MTPQQLFALASPFVVGFVGLLVHFLAPATIAEIGTILGLSVNMLIAVRNLFIVAPSTTKAIQAGTLKVIAPSCVAFALLSLLVDCTPQAQAFAITAEQDACQIGVLTTSVIPIGTDPQAVAADVKLACNLADQAMPYVVQVIAAFEASQAPPPTGRTYVPSPFVLRARASSNVRAFGNGP